MKKIMNECFECSSLDTKIVGDYLECNNCNCSFLIKNRGLE